VNTDALIATCPDPDTLAAFAEGKLKRHELPPILDHLSDCVRCTAAVEAVNEEIAVGSESRLPAAGWWWIAAAAAVIVAVLGVPSLRDRLTGRQSVARLVALAPRSARSVEPRLTGGFAWAAYAGSNRAAGEQPDAGRMKLVGAAGSLVERAGRDGSAEAQHDAGVALVLVRAPADAIPRLEAAARTSNDAAAWSDLAAARYAAAAQLGRASLYPTALAAADAALHIQPNLPEALFNRALILEKLGLTADAHRAWQRYLEADPSSPWAAEARTRMADLPVTTRSSEFEHDRPLLEDAAARGDAAVVKMYIDVHRDRARANAETEYLGRWGEAVQQGQAAEAARWLSIVRAIGDTLAGLSGESLTREAVRAIDNASDRERQTIAAAHVAYRAGRLAYSRHDLDAGQRDLLRSAALFESVHDPMALAAGYYAASVRLSRNETTAARADLERARAAADLHPGFINLGAHVRWELGRAHMLDEDWTGAVPLLSESAAMFRRSGERASEAFVETMLARALMSLGRADEAWMARIGAFAALHAEGEPALLAASIAAAMQHEWLAGRGDAAVALSELGLAAARRSASPGLVVEALATRALLLSATHADEALQATREAAAIARATPDPAWRARLTADVDAATGAALAGSSPRAAAESLTRAIDFFAGHGFQVKLPEVLLLRARCSLRTGDAAAAMRDLERGMAIVERRGEDAGGSSGVVGVLDAEHALFTDAIRLSLDRGDTRAAFAFAERSHLAAIAQTQLQERLRGSGVVVLEIVGLPNELVTFAVSENDFAFVRRTRPAETLGGMADAVLSEAGTTAASALYDDLIRPLEPILGQAREVVIIPDAALRRVPFAALYDARSRRYLVERLPVSIAASAASLRRVADRVGQPSVAAIELPNSGLPLSALPEATREVGEVAAAYRRSRVIGAAGATLAVLRTAAAGADVVHISGHTESQEGGGEQALLVAGGSGSDVDRLSWKTILAAPPLRAGVVVLAACETLRPPASAATRGQSLGGAFAAAGATDVIGTLAPIGDRDARLLFRALHRRLADGGQPAEALRAMQREAIAEDRDGRRAWRAVALLTTRIPVHKKEEVP
jgi:tetratricopeptide (TPR) repeat protein